MRTYSTFQEVKLLPIEERLFLKDRYFPKPDENEINDMVLNHKPCSMERLLRLIHDHYLDEGLRMTLMHRLFDYKSSEIAYYVPELVYIAIRKNSKHMKKILLSHSRQN